MDELNLGIEELKNLGIEERAVGVIGQVKSERFFNFKVTLFLLI